MNSLTFPVIQEQPTVRVLGNSSISSEGESGFSVPSEEMLGTAVLPISFPDVTSPDVVAQFEEIIRRIAEESENKGEYSSENSTAVPNYRKAIQDRLLEIFSSAQNEYFEDGVETEFSRSLAALFRRFHEEAIDVFEAVILRTAIDPKLVAEALSWLGQIDASASEKKRYRKLLEVQLFSGSPYIRSGAAIGLAYLDDPDSIGQLRNASTRETVESIREYIIETIEQLQDTKAERSRRAVSSAENR